MSSSRQTSSHPPWDFLQVEVALQTQSRWLRSASASLPLLGERRSVPQSPISRRSLMYLCSTGLGRCVQGVSNYVSSRVPACCRSLMYLRSMGLGRHLLAVNKNVSSWVQEC